MKAVVCSEYGPIERLSIRSVPEPGMSGASVRIGMKVASINPCSHPSSCDDGSV
jgi:NADPH:quinone reductase-like Zn-dependent oxidoreductase